MNMENSQKKTGGIKYSLGGSAGIEGRIDTSDNTFLETDGDLGGQDL